MDWLKVLTDLLPVLTAVGGGMWALFVYIGHQKDAEHQRRRDVQKEVTTRRVESQKPFLELQLRLYVETSQVAGRLIAFEPPSEEWMAAYRRFWALYWSEMAMVEHERIEKAMDKLADAIQAFKNNQKDENKHALRDRTYELAHAIRVGIESAWGTDRPIAV